MLRQRGLAEQKDSRAQLAAPWWPVWESPADNGVALHLCVQISVMLKITFGAHTPLLLLSVAEKMQSPLTPLDLTLTQSLLDLTLTQSLLLTDPPNAYRPIPRLLRVEEFGLRDQLMRRSAGSARPGDLPDSACLLEREDPGSLPEETVSHSADRPSIDCCK